MERKTGYPEICTPKRIKVVEIKQESGQSITQGETRLRRDDYSISESISNKVKLLYKLKSEAIDQGAS